MSAVRTVYGASNWFLPLLLPLLLRSWDSSKPGIGVLPRSMELEMMSSGGTTYITLGGGLLIMPLSVSSTKIASLSKTEILWTA